MLVKLQGKNIKKKKTSISKAFQTTDKVAYGIMHRPNFSSKASKTCSRTIVSKTSTEPNQIQMMFPITWDQSRQSVENISSWTHETPMLKAAAKTLQVFLKIKEAFKMSNEESLWTYHPFLCPPLCLPPQKKTARSKPTELNHCYASLQHCQNLSSYKALGKHSVRKAWN